MKKLLLALLCAALCLPAAFAEDGSITFFAMDTVMSVRADEADETLLRQCETAIEALEARLSVTRETSEISALNRERAAALSPDTEALLSYALRMCEETDGALDITLYPIIRAWGFTTNEFRVPAPEELEALLPLVDYTRVECANGSAALPDGVMIDLGSVAKGLASDVLADLLRNGDCSSGLIDLGGNLYCVGAKPDGSFWRVGVRDPRMEESYCAVVQLADQAVVTSGQYERYFMDDDGTVYGHIFDPKSGRPVQNAMQSVTIIGNSGLECDALSTALFVMGRQNACAFLQEHTDVEAILIEDDTFYVTKGLKNRFQPAGDLAGADVNWIEREGA